MTLIKNKPRIAVESMQSTNKNLLLNGDFSVCQRLEHKGGLVESNIISGSNGVRIDRWNVGELRIALVLTVEYINILPLSNGYTYN